MGERAIISVNRFEKLAYNEDKIYLSPFVFVPITHLANSLLVR